MTEHAEKSCWQCSEFCVEFPEVMNIINELNTKQGIAVENDILNKLNNVYQEDKIKEIVEYACKLSYVNQISHNEEKSRYEINKTFPLENSCFICKEKITTFNCKEFNVDINKSYVDRDTFESLAQEFFDFKSYVG